VKQKKRRRKTTVGRKIIGGKRIGEKAGKKKGPEKKLPTLRSMPPVKGQ